MSESTWKGRGEVGGGLVRGEALQVLDDEDPEMGRLVGEVTRKGLGPGLAQRIRVRDCTEMLRLMGQVKGWGVNQDLGAGPTLVSPGRAVTSSGMCR